MSRRFKKSSMRLYDITIGEAVVAVATATSMEPATISRGGSDMCRVNGVTSDGSGVASGYGYSNGLGDGNGFGGGYGSGDDRNGNDE